MSYEPEVIIVAGYRVPNSKWTDAWEAAQDSPLFEKYEDFFVNADSLRGVEDCYFGKILYSFGFDCMEEAIDMNKVFTDLNDIEIIQDGFHTFFDDFIPKDERPSFTKWIVGRWI
jgi:hypothetical protein